MIKDKFIGLILLGCAIISNIESGSVKMFSLKNFKGSSFVVEMNYTNNECINLPPNWQNNISSVNTAKLCLELFSALDCGGQKIIVYPGTNQFDLYLWRFDKKTKSAKVCVQHIDYRQNNTNTILFNAGNHHGSITTAEFNLNVEYCENLPPDYKIHSINELKTCFKYFRSSNCQGTPLIFRKNTYGTFSNQNGLESIVSVGRCTEGGPNMTFTTATPSDSTPSTKRNPITISTIFKATNNVTTLAPKYLKTNQATNSTTTVTTNTKTNPTTTTTTPTTITSSTTNQIRIITALRNLTATTRHHSSITMFKPVIVKFNSKDAYKTVYSSEPTSFPKSSNKSIVLITLPNNEKIIGTKSRDLCSTIIGVVAASILIIVFASVFVLHICKNKRSIITTKPILSFNLINRHKCFEYEA